MFFFKYVMRTFPSQQIIYVFFFVCDVVVFISSHSKKSPLNEHEDSQLSKEGKHSTA